MNDIRQAASAALLIGDLDPLRKALGGYLEGYRTGLTWEYDYEPGGPFKYSANDWHSSELQAKAQATQDNYKAWHEGFKAGLLDKKKGNK